MVGPFILEVRRTAKLLPLFCKGIDTPRLLSYAMDDEL